MATHLGITCLFDDNDLNAQMGNNFQCSVLTVQKYMIRTCIHVYSWPQSRTVSLADKFFYQQRYSADGCNEYLLGRSIDLPGLRCQATG